MITPGTRIGLIGRNGAGKSTLIRVLLGSESPDSGSVQRAENLSVAYFDQNREALNPETTLVKTLCPSGEYVDYRGGKIHIRSYLDRFLFSQTQMDMPVGRLSGGEQSRVLLARLMLTQANLLVLDEPTNDLDMATLDVLQDCLLDFPGAILLVSHDRYFLDQISNRLLAFSPTDRSGVLTSFADLSQWEQWHAEELAQKSEHEKQSSSQATISGPVATLPTPSAAKKKKLSFKEQRELDTMESTIQAAESRLAEFIRQSELPENQTRATRMAEIAKQMAETQSEIDRLYSRWSELEA
jgi:ABC transport system ATP-binding/permease protein